MITRVSSEHLRERKRRLFADTIKSVTQMGVRRNLATSELERQSSLATVLSCSPDLVLDSHNKAVGSANLALHQLLESMPQVRMAPAEHSPDLTDGEVRRSVGLLEGMLSLSIRQRGQIAKSLSDKVSLARSIESLRTISEAENQISLRQEDQQSLASKRQLIWLPAVLDVAVQVLVFQNKHSELALQPLISALQQSSTQLRLQTEASKHLPALPEGLSSAAEIQGQVELRKELSELRAVLEEWDDKQPNVQYLIRQLLPWTRIIGRNIEGDDQRISSRTCD